MKTILRNQHGFVVFVSLIMVLISLGYTVGYLHFVMGERILFSQRFAETRARYNALTGISEEINALIKSPNYNTATDTTLEDRELEDMVGGFREVRGMMVENLQTHRSQRKGLATGWSTYNSFVNEPIEVEYTMEVDYRARGFEEFMYLTNEEAPGGGPWLGETVTFGAGEILEGLVYSNDDITMSNFGCPEFINYETDTEFELSQVYTAGVFNFGGCNENSSTLFQGVHKDSMPKIEWPPYEGQDLIKSKADYIYRGNAQINWLDPAHEDFHIMTYIKFEPGQMFIKQWAYQIPPIVAPQTAGQQAAFEDTLKRYYPKFYRNTFGGGQGLYQGDLEFQHFDFPQPAAASLITDDVIMTPEAVIWVEGGQVQVEGTVQGRYTIATSSPQPYKMAHDSTRIQELNCNIWIMDDLVYADSETNGYVVSGSPNRLGLLSGGNIIVANTTPNGKRNSASAANIQINAAMIAMNESFLIQYWQNSTAGYNFLEGGFAIKGDGRGVKPPFLPATGTSDIRGTVMIFGSVVQDKRGYLKRNNPGPYPISPGIGYEKDYHYDRNLRKFPPPEWPETKNTDGSSSLELSGIGEYLGE
ncbi:MAG: hypothetical protein K9M55_08500 [Candidatus Marinimicrobia bacterium]|nr:hypothetical protein [Candidatus Neomarinimicrobiota bacterium]MCF7922727.1 hypothetical protein [Candidatus Neomarinimicrobiota bacterium]